MTSSCLTNPPLTVLTFDHEPPAATKPRATGTKVSTTQSAPVSTTGRSSYQWPQQSSASMSSLVEDMIEQYDNVKKPDAGTTSDATEEGRQDEDEIDYTQVCMNAESCVPTIKKLPVQNN